MNKRTTNQRAMNGGEMKTYVLVLLAACAPAATAPVAAPAKTAETRPASAPASVKPDRTQALLDSANAKERMGDTEGARTDLESAQAQSPDDVAVIAALARVTASQGQYDAADKLLSAAKKAHADAPELWLAAAGIARSQRRYNDALAGARHVLLRNQGNVAALRLIALVNVDQNKFDLAEAYCSNALKLAPNSSELLTTLGYIQYKRGDTARALATLQKAEKTEGNTGAAHADIAFIALAHRDYAWAKSEFAAAKDAGQAQKSVLAGACYALEGLRQLKDAASCFDDFLAQVAPNDADNAGFYLSLGQIQQANKANTAALAAYKRYVELKGAGLSKTDRVLEVIKTLQDNSAQPGNRVETPSAMNRGRPAAIMAAKGNPRS